MAYSGGLDTSAIVPWLKENYNCEVICFVADVGQDREDLVGIEEKAKQSGATKCIIKDLREEFVKNYVYPTLKTGAVYEGTYLLGTSMARPVIAKAMVETALAEGVQAVAHGCTGKGNDQVRFEGAVAALAPQLEVIAPWRIWKMRSREDLLNYLNRSTAATPTHGISQLKAVNWRIPGTELQKMFGPGQLILKKLLTSLNLYLLRLKRARLLQLTTRLCLRTTVLQP